MNNRQMIEIWGDIVEVKALVFAIFISSATTMGAYFIAPKGKQTMELFFGLGGAVLGFIISTIFIEPKRDINIEK